jgi:hypothetical protein
VEEVVEDPKGLLVFNDLQQTQGEEVHALAVAYLGVHN